MRAESQRPAARGPARTSALGTPQRLRWVYTAPTALVVAPALADSRVLAATGWAPAALTLASGLMFVASAPGRRRLECRRPFGRRPSFWTTLGCGICIAVGAAAPRRGRGSTSPCA